MLCADGFRSRAAYHKALEEVELEAKYKHLQRLETEGIEGDWETFRTTTLEVLSAAANRTEHYRRVYRLACEAAHIGDLTVYMPPQPTEIGSRLSDLSFLRAYVCLKFGIILACDLLHDASEALGMGVDQQLDGFRVCWSQIISLSAPATEG